MGKDSLAHSSKAKAKQVEKQKGKGKAVEKQKKGRNVPLRSGGPLVINEGGSKKKTPPVVQDSEDDSETETESSEEEQEPVVRLKDPREAAFKECYEALQKSEILQTRWIDVGLLKRLGIFEDVKMVLGCMGLAKILEMDYVCYPEQTLELISTFELRLCPGATTPSELGRVIFRVNNQWYGVSLSDICAAYGFPQRMGREIEQDEDQDKKIWRLIGKGDYTTGRAKGMRIGNPAVRYVHKVLSNTLYARYEGDKILEDEIALLSNGIQPMFREHFENEGIVGYEDINLGILLSLRIIYLQSWAKREQHKKSKLLMGGFLTPLLKAAKVRLRNPCKGEKLKLDFAALKRMRFLDGKDGNRILYRFVGTDLQPHTILLPNVESTTLNNLQNLLFTSAEDMNLINVAPAEALLAMRNEGEQETRGTSSEIPLGSPRYYFPPYQGQGRGKSNEHILDNLNKSQRWHKWSARNFHNIKRTYKKQVKAFKEEISGLKRMVSYLVKRQSPPQREDGEPDFDFTREEARRYSTSHIPSSSSSRAFDPPRASSHASPTQRKRRFRPVPSPSPPSSDNQSIHLSSSEEDASN